MDIIKFLLILYFMFAHFTVLKQMHTLSTYYDKNVFRLELLIIHKLWIVTKALFVTKTQQ